MYYVIHIEAKIMFILIFVCLSSSTHALLRNNWKDFNDI